MQTSSRLSTFLVAAVAVAGFGQAGIVSAQPRENLPVELTDGPAKPGFDIERFSNAGNGWFETFYVEEMEQLQQALDDGRLAQGTRMLVMEIEEGNLAFVTDQMAFHHLAQGTSEGKHWLATF
jgi:hypothetical protein